jgi:hypothetical protein
MFRLRIEEGPRKGELIVLTPGKPVQLGRGREAELRFPEDATMSRIQAVLTWDQGAWTLTNKSQHGTLIGGARVDTSKTLAQGDQLVLGGTKLVYELDPDSGNDRTLAPGKLPMPEGAHSPGNTPPPMPRAAAAGAAAAAKAGAPAAAGVPPTTVGAPAAGPAAGGATPAGAKPGAKKSSSTTVIVVIVALLGLCCCSSGAGWWFFGRGWWAAHHGASVPVPPSGESK